MNYMRNYYTHTEIDRLQQELRRWKQIALWLFLAGTAQWLWQWL